MIGDVTSSGAMQEAGGAAGASSLGKDQFFRLLITQLSQQDPMNPADSTQFVSQLAQFSSLEQLVSMSAAMDNVALAQAAATSAQMVSFIGKDVHANGDSFVVEEGHGPQDLSFTLPEDAASVTVTIKDQDGNVVRTIEAGAMDAGNQSIEFDGLDQDGNPLPEGVYTFSVQAEGEDGAQIAGSTTITGTVESVSYALGYPELVLDGGRKVLLADVVEVAAPKIDAATAYSRTKDEPSKEQTE